ncbi:hypothetical protein ACFSRY_04905 [Pontibacter locisalis]|uniref:UbiA prenyltransferase family protein n=1 Tax=Pontibacter locisalis TaxID=1719035 RepID=A0ABW5IHS2_9BACT
MVQNQHIGGKHVHTEQKSKSSLRRLGEALLYSSIFISFCAFSLTIVTYKLAGLPVSLPMALFIFLATLFTYNLSSIYSVFRRPGQKISDTDAHWTQINRKPLALLGLISVVTGAFIYFYFSFGINIWFMLHLAFISIGYTIPIVYKSKRVKPLRNIPLLKVFLIAYVWAVVTTLFPLLEAGFDIREKEALILLARRFLFILSLALLFDVRDFSYDRSMNTLTVPGLVGVNNTKFISLALLVIYTITSLQTETGLVQLALLASAIGAGLVVVFSSEDRPRLYYLLFADGAMLLHSGLVLLTLM